MIFFLTFDGLNKRASEGTDQTSNYFRAFASDRHNQPVFLTNLSPLLSVGKDTMPCSLCRKCGHNKTSCPNNPNSKIGKKIDASKKKLQFDRPKPLGAIYQVKFGNRHLGYVANPPPPKKPLKNPPPPKKTTTSKKPTGKITRADIF